MRRCDAGMCSATAPRSHAPCALLTSQHCTTMQSCYVRVNDRSQVVFSMYICRVCHGVGAYASGIWLVATSHDNGVLFTKKHESKLHSCHRRHRVCRRLYIRRQMSAARICPFLPFSHHHPSAAGVGAVHTPVSSPPRLSMPALSI